MRKAKVYCHSIFAGLLQETSTGYSFDYDEAYVAQNKMPISKTLPLRSEQYNSNVLFPFFDGLIPEGWLLDIALDNWKINQRDRFGLLLVCCKNCIGAVSIVPK